MPCACRGRSGDRRSPGAAVTRYQYTSPDKKTVTVFLTPVEAKAEQRRNGGGTIKPIT
ncbi:DUF7196 family protein [Mycobacterium syngnathidarum]